MSALQLITARQLLTSSRNCFARGGVVVRSGRIEDVLENSAAVERASTQHNVEPTDLGDCVLAPGLVNAHAHLELSDLHGKVTSKGSFPDWIRDLLAARSTSVLDAQLEAYESAAMQLARSGCTLVADIDSSGLAASGAGSSSLRVVVYREALDVGDGGRRAKVVSALQASLGTVELEALSPHAPYTVSVELARELAQLALKHNLALGIHWAETAEENDWMERGEGPFGTLLGTSPRVAGLDLLRETNLLGERTALFHANFPRPTDFELVRAAGATIVHCPGAHEFFARASFPLEQWQAAGVPIALGTDSLAGNAELDMQREMALLRRNYPNLTPADCFQMATENGARALGLAGRAGRLSSGAWADFAGFETEADELGEILEAVTSGQAPCLGTWIGGEPVRPRARIGRVGDEKDARRPTQETNAPDPR